MIGRDDRAIARRHARHTNDRRHQTLRWGDRWFDDGSDLELWTDDEQAGLRLHVTAAGELIASRLGGVTSGHARIQLDPSSHDVLVDDSQGVLGPPLDLDWLQTRLDLALREAISERASRARRDDHHDWKEGDKPRVSLGEDVRFSDVFPASWDLLVTHGDKRYALLDRYRVDEGADEGPIAIEVIDLVAGASVPMISPVRAIVRPGRNEPCWCGSKQKYKKCHLDSDEAERLSRP